MYGIRDTEFLEEGRICDVATGIQLLRRQTRPYQRSHEVIQSPDEVANAVSDRPEPDNHFGGARVYISHQKDLG